jgi:hypothetical protein
MGAPEAGGAHFDTTVIFGCRDAVCADAGCVRKAQSMNATTAGVTRLTHLNNRFPDALLRFIRFMVITFLLHAPTAAVAANGRIMRLGRLAGRHLSHVSLGEALAIVCDGFEQSPFMFIHEGLRSILNARFLV